MAGIGFELKKILRKQTFLSEFTAYLYAAMVSSGPWLMSIICLAVLGMYRGSGLVGVREHEIFRATVIYTYAFSLIFVGLVQLVVTRYLADDPRHILDLHDPLVRFWNRFFGPFLRVF